MTYAPYTPPPAPKKHRARNTLAGIGTGVVLLAVVGALTGSPTPAAAPVPVVTPTSSGTAPAPAPATTTTAPATVTYTCTGQAPDGIDITYGPEGTSLSATTLPFHATTVLNPDAMYYTVNAQLSGSGHVTCTTTIQTGDGTVTAQTAQAEGGYNIATAEVCSSFDGGWEAC